MPRMTVEDIVFQCAAETVESIHQYLASGQENTRRSLEVIVARGIKDAIIKSLPSRSVEASAKEVDDEANELFEEWWKRYDKPVGKKPAKAKWAKLTDEEHDKCLAVVDAYVASTPDKTYRCQPITYLNQSRWEDDLVAMKNQKPEVVTSDGENLNAF